MLALQSAPATVLISTTDAKAHCRVDGSDEDGLIAGFVSTATQRLDGADGILGRALISQTWRLYLDSAPLGPVALPLPRVQSIDSIGYYDADGAEQTLAASNYRLFAAGDTARVELTDAGSWPATDGRSGALWVDFVAGYGDDATDVPAPIRQAALLMVSHFNENREAVTGFQSYELPMAVAALVAPYRVVGANF